MSDAEQLRAIADWINEHQNGGIYSGGLVTEADLRRIASRLEALDTVTIRTPRGFEGETSDE
jgi:thiamine pyrophosphate-dependent acetolactate synthase large subunit-like protein